MKNNKLNEEDIIKLVLEEPTLYRFIKSLDNYTDEEKQKCLTASTECYWIIDEKPIQYMKLPNKIKFSGKEDYRKLADTYLNCELSLRQFCRKFNFNKKDFKHVLDLLSIDDDELAKNIEQKQEKEFQKFEHAVEDFSDKILNGETTMAEVIHKTNGGINAWHFIKSKSFMDEKKHTNLIAKIVSELKQAPPEEYKDEISNNYDLPQIGKWSMSQLCKLFAADDVKEPIKNVQQALATMDKYLQYKTNGDVDAEIKRTIYNFSQLSNKHRDLNENEYKKQKRYKIVNGEQVEVVEKNVDDAIAIIEAHNGVRSLSLLNYVITDIMNGKYNEEDINKAYEKIEKAQKRKNENKYDFAKEIKNFDDLIDCLSNSSKKHIDPNVQKKKELIAGIKAKQKELEEMKKQLAALEGQTVQDDSENISIQKD